MRSSANIRVAILIAVLTAAMVGAHAQAVSSGAQAISLNAALTESISLTLSAGAVNFNLTAGSASNPGSTSISATTSWVLRPSRGRLNVYAFFSSASSALSDGSGNNIPSSSFQVSENGGAFLALTNAVPFGGANAGLQLATVPILGNNKQGSRTDTMNFNINLSTTPSLPAGVYTGTLTIQVQAI